MDLVRKPDAGEGGRYTRRVWISHSGCRHRWEEEKWDLVHVWGCLEGVRKRGSVCPSPGPVEFLSCSRHLGGIEKVICSRHPCRVRNIGTLAFGGRGDSVPPLPKTRGFLLYNEELEKVVPQFHWQPWACVVLAGSIRDGTRARAPAHVQRLRRASSDRRRGKENGCSERAQSLEGRGVGE